MPVVIESEGKTVSEAVISTCENLGVSWNEVEVEVLEEGSKGVLGIGGKKARVRLTLLREDVTEKGLRARRTLDVILGFLGPSSSVSLNETAEEIRLEIKGNIDKGLIIGKGGSMLRSLEYIVGKIAGRSSQGGREKRVWIDIDEYKKRKKESITRLIKDSVNKVHSLGKPVTLDPMPASDRRLVYIALKGEEGVRVETMGEGDLKRIVINPARRGRGKSAEREA